MRTAQHNSLNEFDQDVRREVRRADRTVTRQQRLRTLLTFTAKYRQMINHYRITDQSMRILLMLTDSWVNHRTGMTINTMVNASPEHTRGILGRFKARVEVLEKKGLIEVIGYSKHKARLFAPTVIVVDEVLSLVDE